MPPVVHRHHVARAPVLGAGVEIADPFGEPPLHLQRVHDGVDAPHVPGVPGDGGQRHLLGPRVLPRLLQPEPEHAQQRPVVRVLLVPHGQGTGDAVAQRARVPGEEVDLVSDSEREGISRPGDRQLPQQRPGTLDVPREPHRCHLEMGPLARGERALLGSGPKSRELLPRHGHLRSLRAQQPQIGRKRMPHRAARCHFAQRTYGFGNITPEEQQRIDGPLIEPDRLALPASTTHLQPMPIPPPSPDTRSRRRAWHRRLRWGRERGYGRAGRRGWGRGWEQKWSRGRGRGRQ